MAVNDRGKYYTNAGWVPGVVLAQRDENGDVVADGAGGETNAVVDVDVLLLGYAQGRRTAAVGTGVNEFEFTDDLAA